MKILVLGDLHCHKNWFSWVLERIPSFDLVALPGDLLDCFGTEFDLQKQFVTDWFAQAAELGVPIAWCSGNHDMIRWSFEHPDLRPGACWSDEIRGSSTVGDFETKTFSGVGQKPFLVSCLPYTAYRSDPFENRVEALLSKATEQRKDLGCTWILLNHEPPSQLPLSRGEEGDLGDDFLRLRIEQYQPDFVLSGHVHQGPFRGPFGARIGRSTCFNAGCDLEAPFPFHIVIDNEQGSAVFHYERYGQIRTEKASYRNLG